MKSFVAALTLVCAAAFAEPTYTVTNIGTLGGTSSSANDINNRGQVVGGSTDASGASRAFLFENGTIRDLGNPPFNPVVNAKDILNNGDIFVSGANADNPNNPRLFRWRDNDYDELGTLIGGNEITVQGAADPDFVTGYGSALEGTQRAFIRHENFYNTLGTLGGFGSVGQAINSKGHTAGYSGTASGNTHAFVYTGPVGRDVTVGPLQDLGTLGGSSSQANSINERDQIVGQSSINAQSTAHAFLYENGRMKDLGTFTSPRTGTGSSSFANDINNLGDIVGYVQAAGGATPYTAFLYRDGVMQDLNALIPASSGWDLWFASAINDSGQIVGSGTFNGAPRAFLLTPGSGGATPPTTIPLPPGAAAGSFTLGLFFCFRARRCLQFLRVRLV
ncbi:MAG TPA: hypothetical protein VF669_03250 [Tepidisphaeraceae bacterium]|jgi:probable HAF family extracellular repeat protein